MGAWPDILKNAPRNIASLKVGRRICSICAQTFDVLILIPSQLLGAGKGAARSSIAAGKARLHKGNEHVVSPAAGAIKRTERDIQDKEADGTDFAFPPSWHSFPSLPGMQFNKIWKALKTLVLLRLDSFVSGSGGGDKAAGWWVRGSEYLRKRVRRAVYDEESGEIVGAEDGEIVGWLPLEVADFVSEFFKKPAALWHMVYDNVAVGEVSLSPLSLSLLSIPPLSLTPSFPPRACVRRARSLFLSL